MYLRHIQRRKNGRQDSYWSIVESRQLGNLDGLQASQGSRALILKARGDLDGAMALHKEAEHICRQLGNLDVLQATLGKQAYILSVRGELDGAMALYKEEERICRQLGNPEGLARSLVSQTVTWCQMGRVQESLPLAEEAYKIATSQGYARLAKQIEPILDSVRAAAGVPRKKQAPEEGISL